MNLKFFADLYGMRSTVASDRIRRLLSWVGLANRQESPIATFSRGMRARLGIARALVHRPRVIFLDEPTRGLDPVGQRDMLELIQHVNRDEAVYGTVIIGTDQPGHDSARTPRDVCVGRGRPDRPIVSSSMTIVLIRDNRVLNPANALPVAIGGPLALVGLLVAVRFMRTGRAC